MAVDGAIDAALYTVLNVPAVTNLATGGVWNSEVAEGTAAPYVVFSQAAGSVGQTFDKRLHSTLYLIRAIVKAKWPAAATAIHAQVDALLNNKRLAVAGGQNLIVLEEAPFRMREDAGGGVLFWHVGASFRIQTDEAG